MSINNPVSKTPQPNQDKPMGQGEAVKSPEEKLRQEFLKRQFLIVEDDPTPVQRIVNDLKKERGLEQDAEDLGIILYFCFKLQLPSVLTRILV